MPLMQHLRDEKDPIMEGILTDVEHMLARGKSGMPLSLGFAAKRSDDLLLHQLLRRGADPNETDHNGRTAMVHKFCLHTFPENCCLLI